MTDNSHTITYPRIVQVEPKKWRCNVATVKEAEEGAGEEDELHNDHGIEPVGNASDNDDEEEYNSRIRTLRVLCTYCACTQHVLRVYSVGGLAVQHSDCTLFVLRYVLYSYSGGGWDMVMGGGAVPYSGAYSWCTVNVLSSG